MEAGTESMRGEICLVTGATSGIGKETARALAGKGATLIVVGRNQERCISTVHQIQRQTNNPSVEYLLADLSSQEQIRRLAKDFRHRHARLDVLVNNAGGFFLRRRESADGIEMTFALNHLGYFLLTNLLIDLLKQSPPSRIVNVASGSHWGATLDFNDLTNQRRYSPMRAYSQSKLANILFTYELARRLKGTGVTANALHPGRVATNIGANNGWIIRLFLPLVHRGSLPVEEGAKTSIFLASSPEVEGLSGGYYAQQKLTRSSEYSYDEEAAQRLWRMSANLTGLAETI